MSLIFGKVVLSDDKYSSIEKTRMSIDVSVGRGKTHTHSADIKEYRTSICKHPQHYFEVTESLHYFALVKTSNNAGSLGITAILTLFYRTILYLA